MPFNQLYYPYKLPNLRRNQWLSTQALKELQERKLKALVRHAYNKVNYYRSLFERVGLKPEDIKNIQDLAKIPITTRKDLQGVAREEIIAKHTDPSRCINLRTSGSTGAPLDIYVNRKEFLLRGAFYLRFYLESGGKLTDKELIITANLKYYTARKWFQYLGILRKKYISLFDSIENQLRYILEFKPDSIGSYASVLEKIADEIENRNIKNITPRIIFPTAELMTKNKREHITRAFQAEVFDSYGCNECGIIAWECKEHFGYHINADSIIVEFIKEGVTNAGDSEESEIVITNLDSYTMPFIRYGLQDKGVVSYKKCSCGRSFPLMKIITGRTCDYIILPDGKNISPYVLTTAMEELTGVKNFQIIQEEKDKIIINVIRNNNLSFGALSKIKETFNNILGYNIEVKINVVEEINKNFSGKFVPVKSEIK